MLKAKLSDAVNSAATESEAPKSETPVTVAPEQSNPSDDSDDEPAALESESEGDADAPKKPDAEKSLADFRSAFGHSEGSVFFVDNTPFVNACQSTMQSQAATIAEQAKQIAELTALNQTMAQGIHGELDPLQLGGEDETSRATQQDGVGAFAASLKLPMKK